MYIHDKELDFQNETKKIVFSRRGFLGSILGTFAVAQLPWIAREPFVERITQPKIILPGYTSYQRLVDGTIIQGPGVKEIKEGAVLLHDIWINQQLDVAGSILYYEGKLLSDANFSSGSQVVYNGDVLKVTHNLEVAINNKLFRPSDQEDIDKYLYAKELFK